MLNSPKEVMRTLRLGWIAGAFALAGLSTSAVAQTEDELFKAALAEGGTLTLYTSATEPEALLYINAFEERYPGIKVDWIRLSSGSQHARFKAEHDAGVVNADVLHSGSAAIEIDNPDLFETITPELVPNSVNAGIPAQADSYLVVYSTPVGIVYNTDLISKEDVEANLATWEGFADPFWADKISMIDPFSNTSALGWYKLMWDTYGDEWMRKVAANRAAFQPSSQPAAQSVAAGEYPLAMPISFLHGQSLADKGAPVIVARPEGPSTGIESSLGIPKGSPHPNSGRLFVDFMLGKEAQTLVCSWKGIMPVYDGAEGDCVRVPDNYTSPAIVLTADDEKKLGELIGRE